MPDSTPSQAESPADLLLLNGRIATQDAKQSFVSALAIRSGRIQATGDAATVMAHKGAATRVVELNGRTVIPGLIDSHSHPIRGGLSYNLELRWDGVPSLADAMRMLREQARRTPPNHWVRVIGGWSEFQFAERRMPTLEELNAAAPDTPVFVLHLYASAMLNRAALRVVGYTRDTPNPPAGEIQRDKAGNPTGLLIARPNAFILLDARQGPEAALRAAAQFDPAVHARAEPARSHQRDRCRWGFPELPAGLPGRHRAAQERAADRAARCEPLYAAPERGARGFLQLGENGEAGPGRRPVPHQRRRRDAGLLGGRLRGFS